jgi:predicted NUDIX family phosphoesterase
MKHTDYFPAACLKSSNSQRSFNEELEASRLKADNRQVDKYMGKLINPPERKVSRVEKGAGLDAQSKLSGNLTSSL